MARWTITLWAGHVAMWVSATGSGFTSLDQNWPVGALPPMIMHDYKNVLGWLRPVDTASHSTVR